MTHALELIELSNLRMNTYNLLSRAFCEEVDGEFWRRLKALDYCRANDGSPLGLAYAQLGKFLEEHPNEPPVDLAVDFAALFLGAGPRNEGAFPYESIYTSDNKLMTQEACDDMLSLLRKHSLAPQLTYVENEDHVSVEFALLAYCSKQTIACLERGEQEQAVAWENERIEVLRRHIANWVPAFCRDVECFASTGFYQAFAKIAEAFIEADQKLSPEAQPCSAH